MHRPLSIMSFKSDLGKIIVKLVILILCILAMDLVIYTLIGQSLKNIGTGELGFQHVIKSKYDIVIFGASKSTTNYDPSIIKDVTGMSCYSLGSTGSTFLAQYPQLVRILDAYTPHIVVFELIGDDLDEGLLSYKAGRVVDRMLLHIDNKDVYDLITQIDKWHGVKSVIRSYRYTSVIGDRIVELFRSRDHTYDPRLGYNPKERNPNFVFKIEDDMHARNDEIAIKRNNSPIIERAFERMLSELQRNSIHAVFVHSPNYMNRGSRIDPTVIRMIHEKGMEFYDMADNVVFDYNECDYYSDELHLSPQGANEYSRVFAMFLLSLPINP